eukprot:2172706-Alexandrium_andersonii.AAC.1
MLLARQPATGLQCCRLGMSGKPETMLSCFDATYAGAHRLLKRARSPTAHGYSWKRASHGN